MLGWDFTAEQPGYIHKTAIRKALLGTRLREEKSTRVMIERCYEVLILNGWVDPGEEPLLRA